MSRQQQQSWFARHKGHRQRLASHGSRGNPQRRQLRFEPLEDRRLLSITVNTLFDENDGIGVGEISLRDAIAAAVPGDTIDFSPALTNGGPATLVLSHGELKVDKGITINGPGAGLLSVSASGNDPTPGMPDGKGSRVFNVDDGIGSLSQVRISGLTLTGADLPFSARNSGTVSNRENLTIDACTITGNIAFTSGIGNYATLSVTHSTITSNPFNGINSNGGNLTVDDSVITGNAGGVNIGSGNLSVSNTTIANNASFSVGGIHASNVGTITITDSDITNNTSRGTVITTVNGGGIYAVGANTSMTVQNSVISGNIAEGTSTRGGGIYFSGNALSLTNCTVNSNTASSHGGGIYATHPSTLGNVTLTSTTISSNSAGGNGGGICNHGKGLTLTNCTVSGNTAHSGGGIYQDTSNVFILSVVGSTISGNSAVSSWGGGILSKGNTGLHQSTVSGNTAAYDGGGVMIPFSRLTVVESTISGNTSGHNGGGIWSGVVSYSGPSVIDSTITANVASNDGGGIWASTVKLKNSIAAGNSRNNGEMNDVTGEIYVDPADLLSLRLLLGVDTGTTFSDSGTEQNLRYLKLVGTSLAPVDPHLGPLVNNGGPTATHALLPGSRAIDRGINNTSAPANDQRGAPFVRVSDGDGNGSNVIDIGAFEVQPNPLPGDYNFNGVVDAADYVIWRHTLGSTSDLRADGNGNGSVGPEDYDVWKSHFGMTLPPPSAAAGSGALAAGASEPVQQAVDEQPAPETEATISTIRASQSLHVPTSDRFSTSTTPQLRRLGTPRGHTGTAGRTHFDELLVARLFSGVVQDRSLAEASGDPHFDDNDASRFINALDEVFALLDAGLNAPR